MIKDAEEHREQDKKKKEFAELIVNAEGLVYSTEKSLEEFGNLLSEKDRQEIAQALQECKNILEKAEAKDFQELKRVVTKLETAAHRIADAMYKQAAEEK